MDPDSSGFTRIPADVMEQILGKIPLSDLVSLRLVCKKWTMMICYLYSPPCHVPKCVPVHFMNGKLTVYNSSTKSWELHPLSFFQDRIQTARLDLVASAGGLLCFVTDKFGQVVVCNPISKTWKMLQIPPRIGDEDFMSGPKPDKEVTKLKFSAAEMPSKRKTMVGLLVDSFTGYYKIIVATLHEDCSRATMVYDSLNCSWKKGTQVPEAEEFTDSSAILCNGSLYCLVKTATLNGELLRYNVKTNTWSRLSLDMSVMRCKLVEQCGQVFLVKRSSYYSVESAFRFFQLHENYLSMTLIETDVLDGLNLDNVSISKVMGHLKSTGRGSIMGQNNFLYVLKPPYEDGLRKKRTVLTIIDLSTGSCDVLCEMIVATTDAEGASIPLKHLVRNVFHLFSPSLTVRV